jgi:uncharacterized protein YjaZ
MTPLTDLAKQCGAKIGVDVTRFTTSTLTAFVERIRQEEREKAEQDARRFDWYFGDKPKGDWLMTYLSGMRAGWTTDQWRAAIDAAIREASNA